MKIFWSYAARDDKSPRNKVSNLKEAFETVKTKHINQESNMNNLDTHEAIKQRAAELGCIVVETFSGKVLAKRESDQSFITWSYMIVEGTGKAEFYWGHYDMDLETAAIDLQTRS